jgi:cell division protein FtsI (penicillin-binding protein 3)
MRKQRRNKRDVGGQTAFTRFMLIVAVFVLWIGGISVRLVHLQVTQHEWLSSQAEANRTSVKQSKLMRGTILDRNNRTLAMSVSAQTLYADPTEMADPDGAARSIAKALKMDAAGLATQLRQAKEAKKRYVPLLKKLDTAAVQKLNKALDTPDVKKADLPNFAGLHWRDEQKRSYPQGSLAAQIIGFSNEADEGVAGIEQSQDDILHGAVVKRYQERDRLGRVYDEEVTEREAPADVVLTIDSAYQYMVEQALEKGVKQANAKSGIAVVLSAKTGEILALANYPTFDPNLINSKTTANITNNAIQSIYSPGSTFKLITYGAGLEKRLFNPNDMISAGNGTIEVANHVFTDSHAVGTVSYSQAMAHSSNVCAIKTAMGVGREDFASMVKKMGFGSKIGIELPAETAGIVRPIEKWNGDSLASMSIGYEIGVTALQMTSAFATIANDGIRIKPRIIKEIRRAGETPPQAIQPEQTQVVTKDTARHLRTMLKQVVLTGTGRRAQLSGYSVAGKTGTAWKVNTKSRSVDSSKYISSFIGMAPADDPEIVVGVIMDEPKAGARDGGMVSAPVFSEIAQQLLHEMQVPTDAPIRQDSETVADIPEALTIDRKRGPTGSDTKPAAKPDPKAKAAAKPAATAKNAKGVPKGIAAALPVSDLSFSFMRRKVDVET